MYGFEQGSERIPLPFGADPIAWKGKIAHGTQVTNGQLIHFIIAEPNSRTPLLSPGQEGRKITSDQVIVEKLSDKPSDSPEGVSSSPQSLLIYGTNAETRGSYAGQMQLEFSTRPKQEEPNIEIQQHRWNRLTSFFRNHVKPPDSDTNLN